MFVAGFTSSTRFHSYKSNLSHKQAFLVQKPLSRDRNSSERSNVMPSNLLRIISKGRFRNKGLMEWKSATCDFFVGQVWSFWGCNPGFSKRLPVTPNKQGHWLFGSFMLRGYRKLQTIRDYSQTLHLWKLTFRTLIFLGHWKLFETWKPKDFKVAAVGFWEGSVSKDPGEGIAITNRKKLEFFVAMTSNKCGHDSDDVNLLPGQDLWM